ncbi:unnamed protein product [Ilex paraguariensis]|uniref:Uncharacterized protein n=1 Tax=Ilex paraguariensis TaxID=185542 RepID=A0ABC8SPT3_9AQUA
MAESKPDPSSNSSPDKGVKAPNLFERAKEEIDAMLHFERRSHHHHKETHGLRNDIDENTPITDLKAPNVFERAKEEIEALVQTIHPKKDSKPSHDETRDASTKSGPRPEKSDSHSGKDAKAHNLIERTKDQIEGIMHKEKVPHHNHKETHGRSDDIDENTPIEEIKAPNVFERAKEEIEALFQTMHQKKESGNGVSSAKKEGGKFTMSIGRGLERICSPRGHNKDPHS